MPNTSSRRPVTTDRPRHEARREATGISDTPQTVSLGFIAAQMQKLFAEMHDIKIIADLDRRNRRAHYDNLAAEMTRLIGAIDGKLEFAVEQIERRLDGIEALLRDKA